MKDIKFSTVYPKYHPRAGQSRETCRKCIELVEAKREAEGKKKMTVVFPL